MCRPPARQWLGVVAHRVAQPAFRIEPGEPVGGVRGG
jgi:hypothetical protein